MKKTIKNIKGITLISLIVTLIALFILAAITLTLVLGQNGIISKAQYAKTQTEISGEKEQLSMAAGAATLDNTGKQATLEQIKDKIIENGITTNENIKVGDDRIQATTPKGHTYTIDQNGNVEYVGDGAVTVPDLTDANVAFTYTPSSWTNGNTQVEMVTTIKGFDLQYSMDGSTWNTYKSPITIEANKTIYSRLWDGINYGGVATGNVTNIDKTNPTLTISTTNTTNSITVTATGADNDSGIAGYKYSKDNGSTWTDLITDNTYTYTGLTQGQAYQIVVQTYDKAGNTVSKSTAVTTGSVTGLTSANTTFTYTPSTWTNGNVQVGITTTETGYTLQYSTDGSTWNTYTSAITIESNGAIYARLFDGTNYGGTATGNVTNIDKINPTLTISTTNTTNSITIIATGTDNESGISGYKYSKDNGSTWTNLITDSTYTYTGLTQGQANRIVVQAVDKAGNTVSKNATVTTGSVTGLTSANTTFTYTPSTWTNGNVQVGMSTTVTGYTLQYSTDGSTWNTYTSAITITGNQPIYTRLSDGTNCGGVATGNVTNIDRVAPSVPTITYNGGANTCCWKNNYNLTLASTDNVGINYYEIDWNNDGVADTTTGPNFIPWDGYSSCTNRFRAVDYAGNRSGWTDAQHIHMDTSAPSKTTVNLNGYTSGVSTSGNVTQTYSATDNVGVAKYQCSNDGGATWYDVSNPWVISWDGQWSFYIRAVDYAGNIGPASDIYYIIRHSIAYLINGGTLDNSLTGGWTAFATNLNAYYTTIAMESSGYYITIPDSNNYGGIVSNNMIDMTNVKKIHANVTLWTNENMNVGIHIGISPNQYNDTNSFTRKYGETVYIPNGSNVNRDITIDVSDITGYQYLKAILCHDSTEWYNVFAMINSIYLEY